MNPSLEEIEAAAQRGAEKGTEDAVKKVLTSLGIDVENPHEVQADQYFVRRQRNTQEALSKNARIALITSFVTSVIALVIVGFKNIK
ncbi:hypothetical protein ACU6U9_02455 [Pseudomonas sp. HK3]